MAEPTALIPDPVLRRLTLSLLGFRCIHGVWCRGPALTEEMVDRMTTAQFEAFISVSLSAISAASAASTN